MTTPLQRPLLSI
ncbi:hypothetical protein EC970010_2359A, partial [Escherichia coli 97.0010]